MAELLVHPWIAQYTNPQDARIAAYHPIPAAVPAKQSNEAAVTSVLDSSKVLSSSGGASEHINYMAETIRPVSTCRPVVSSCSLTTY